MEVSAWVLAPEQTASGTPYVFTSFWTEPGCDGEEIENPSASVGSIPADTWTLVGPVEGTAPAGTQSVDVYSGAVVTVDLASLEVFEVRLDRRARDDDSVWGITPSADLAFPAGRAGEAPASRLDRRPQTRNGDTRTCMVASDTRTIDDGTREVRRRGNLRRATSRRSSLSQGKNPNDVTRRVKGEHNA